jgi:hypothetical protein
VPTTQELWFIRGHCRYPGAAPIILWPESSSPTQEQGGEIRLCIDYRLLNAITKKDCYLILLIKETMANIAGCRIITKLDIWKAFNKIRIATPENKDLLTFCISLGNYKPKVLQFDLTNSLATF